jgi:hypothetical protein
MSTRTTPLVWRCARCDLVQPFLLDTPCPRCGCWWLALDGTWKHVGGPNWPKPKPEETKP